MFMLGIDYVHALSTTAGEGGMFMLGIDYTHAFSTTAGEGGMFMLGIDNMHFALLLEVTCLCLV